MNIIPNKDDCKITTNKLSTQPQKREKIIKKHALEADKHIFSYSN